MRSSACTNSCWLLSCVITSVCICCMRYCTLLLMSMRLAPLAPTLPHFCAPSNLLGRRVSTHPRPVVVACAAPKMTGGAPEVTSTPTLLVSWFCPYAQVQLRLQCIGGLVFFCKVLPPSLPLSRRRPTPQLPRSCEPAARLVGPECSSRQVQPRGCGPGKQTGVVRQHVPVRQGAGGGGEAGRRQGKSRADDRRQRFLCRGKQQERCAVQSPGREGAQGLQAGQGEWAARSLLPSP